MRVMIVDKITKERTLLEDNLTEQQAEQICEEWGWNYIDEDGKSFWLEYEEEN